MKSLASNLVNRFIFLIDKLWKVVLTIFTRVNAVIYGINHDGIIYSKVALQNFLAGFVFNRTSALKSGMHTMNFECYFLLLSLGE